jgi:glycosyltransferase involved in cell wall biosynthesis
MKKNLWLIYFSGRISSVCDYMFREAKELSRDNCVVCFLLYARPYSVMKQALFHREKAWYRRGGIYYLHPIYIIPFCRFQFITIINKILFIVIVLPIAFYMIEREENISVAHKRLFMFYRPEKEKWYFSRLFTAVKTLGFITVFNLVDYPPTDDTATMNTYHQYVKRSDFAFANSHILKHVFNEDRSDIHVVPQGFALDEFTKKSKRRLFIPKGKPIVGFVGALGSRLDFPLLFTLIENNPQWNFVFWGPKQIVENDDVKVLYMNLKKLLSYKNVIHGESRSKQDIQSVLKRFTVCIIPYDVSQKSNQYCYPMKLFEYFYAGKQVLSTPIEELKRFPKFVTIGTDADDWEKSIRRLLSKPWPDEFKNGQQLSAIENSWKNKITKILSFAQQDRFSNK